MRLLIADDEKIIARGLLQLDWNSIGIQEVRAVDNGVDALQVLSQYNPHIVLTDIKMPGMNGLELAGEISKIKNCKTILLTGYGTFEYAKTALKNGVFDYLLKPASPEEVLEVVKRAKSSLENEGVSLIEAEFGKIIKKINDVDGQNDTIHAILDYIEKHYMENITLATLSEYMYFSTAYLSKLIKKSTSYNFSKILTTIRMIKATELLKHTNLKIYSICEKIGMNDQRYFSQLFSKTFGKTPMAYRKESHEQNVTHLVDVIKRID